MKYKLGTKQRRAILNDRGRELVVFKIGLEDMASKVCDLLNREEPVTIDRAKADPYNTTNECMQLYKCKCGFNSVWGQDKYCSKCGSKLKFINKPPEGI